MAAPCCPAQDFPRTARLVRAIQDLAEDTLESSAQTHLRIDMLALRLQNLVALLGALKRCVAQLEGQLDATGSQGSCFLEELD